ncbi:MAG: hypothetical protein Kow0092_27770 [Deferrisomatales bacterium]
MVHWRRTFGAIALAAVWTALAAPPAPAAYIGDGSVLNGNEFFDGSVPGKLDFDLIYWNLGEVVLDIQLEPGDTNPLALGFRTFINEVTDPDAFGPMDLILWESFHVTLEGGATFVQVGEIFPATFDVGPVDSSDTAVWIAFDPVEALGFDAGAPVDPLQEPGDWLIDTSGVAAGAFTMRMQGFGDGPLPDAPVPVPATLWLLGSGLAGLAGVARRRARG